MVWPTGKPLTTAFDSDDDPISTARPELQTMATTVGSMVDAIDTSGITDGQILIYNASQSKFIAGAASSGSGNVTASTGDNIAIYSGDSAGGLSSTVEGSPSRELTYDPAISGMRAGGYAGISGQVGVMYSGDGIGGAKLQINLNSTSPDVSPHCDFLTVNPLTGSVAKITTPNTSTSLELSTGKNTNSGEIQINPGVTGDINVYSRKNIELNPTGSTSSTGYVNVSGKLSGTSSSAGYTNTFVISAENLTDGKVRIYNDRSETGAMLEVGQADIILKPGPNDSAGLGGDSAGNGYIDFQTLTTTSIGTNGGADATTTNPVGYIEVKVNGQEYIMPYYRKA